MQRQLRRAGVVVTAVALLGLGFSSVATGQSQDPRLGTWNYSKSTGSPASWKSQTTSYEASGAGVKVTTETVNADGSRVTNTYTANADGNDYPFTTTAKTPNFDAVVMKKVDANTVDVTLKKAGNVVLTRHMVVSKDGKVMTVTDKGTPGGQRVDSVLVYDKQ